MVTQVEAKLAKTNNVIKKDRLIIDPETKEIVQYSPYTIFAASVKGANRLHSGCYYKFFWWGVRIYFTSNAAVSWFRGYLSSGSKIAGLVGTIFSGTGHEITGITASTASRYLSMSSGMLYMYNKRHSKSKICMDIPSLSFHTF